MYLTQDVFINFSGFYLLVDAPADIAALANVWLTEMLLDFCRSVCLYGPHWTNN